MPSLPPHLFVCAACPRATAGPPCTASSVGAAATGLDVIPPHAVASLQYGGATNGGGGGGGGAPGKPAASPSWRWSSRAALQADVALQSQQAAAAAAVGDATTPAGAGRLPVPPSRTSASTVAAIVPGEAGGGGGGAGGVAAKRPTARGTARGPSGLSTRPSSSGTAGGGSAARSDGTEALATVRQAAGGTGPSEPSPYVALNVRLRLTQDRVCVVRWWGGNGGLAQPL